MRLSLAATGRRFARTCLLVTLSLVPHFADASPVTFGLYMPHSYGYPQGLGGTWDTTPGGILDTAGGFSAFESAFARSPFGDDDIESGSVYFTSGVVLSKALVVELGNSIERIEFAAGGSLVVDALAERAGQLLPVKFTLGFGAFTLDRHEGAPSGRSVISLTSIVFDPTTLSAFGLPNGPYSGVYEALFDFNQPDFGQDQQDIATYGMLSVQSVPEPATLALMALATVGGLVRRRARQGSVRTLAFVRSLSTGPSPDPQSR